MISALAHYMLGDALPLPAQARQACGLFGLCVANSLTAWIIAPICSDFVAGRRHFQHILHKN